MHLHDWRDLLNLDLARLDRGHCSLIWNASVAIAVHHIACSLFSTRALLPTAMTDTPHMIDSPSGSPEPTTPRATEVNAPSLSQRSLEMYQDVGQSTPGLAVPPPRDGFFDYSQEKSLQHVR